MLRRKRVYVYRVTVTVLLLVSGCVVSTRMSYMLTFLFAPSRGPCQSWTGRWANIPMQVYILVFRQRSTRSIKIHRTTTPILLSLPPDFLTQQYTPATSACPPIFARDGRSAMSHHTLDLPSPSSSLPVEDEHQISHESRDTKKSSREDDTQEQAVQEMEENPKSNNTEVQDPSDLDLSSEEHLRVSPRPLVTILPQETALLNSQTAARLLPHLPPYEWSFWTDACLRGPKPHKLQGCGFCVVHHRLDRTSPSDKDLAITWWQCCFVARNVHDSGYAQMLAVAQALDMAVDWCERISGTVVTKARIKMPGKAEEIKRQASTITWPMPKVVNVFTSSQQVLKTIDNCWLLGWEPSSRSPLRRANTNIEALSGLGVKVCFHWVPGHIHDIRNRWAHEGAKNALKPQYHGRKVRTAKQHRVHWRAQKDRTMPRTFRATSGEGT